MEEKKIRRNLYRVLRKTGVQKNDILPEASFINDLNFDTVDWKIFTFYLEGIFDISVPDEDLLSFKNVNEAVKFLKNTA
ncbi:MAG: acyl carrier protein [Mariniphaga sp.]|nr:acyl carrier protein [Mariniphaga sp.]MDD4424295.1 acyl carrier protein [Mariniphaga sp.]